MSIIFGMNLNYGFYKIFEYTWESVVYIYAF